MSQLKKRLPLALGAFTLTMCASLGFLCLLRFKLRKREYGLDEFLENHWLWAFDCLTSLALSLMVAAVFLLAYPTDAARDQVSAILSQPLTKHNKRAFQRHHVLIAAVGSSCYFFLAAASILIFKPCIPSEDPGAVPYGSTTSSYAFAVFSGAFAIGGFVWAWSCATWQPSSVFAAVAAGQASAAAFLAFAIETIGNNLESTVVLVAYAAMGATVSAGPIVPVGLNFFEDVKNLPKHRGMRLGFIVTLNSLAIMAATVAMFGLVVTPGGQMPCNDYVASDTPTADRFYSLTTVLITASCITAVLGLLLTFYLPAALYQQLRLTGFKYQLSRILTRKTYIWGCLSNIIYSAIPSGYLAMDMGWLFDTANGELEWQYLGYLVLGSTITTMAFLLIGWSSRNGLRQPRTPGHCSEPFCHLPSFSSAVSCSQLPLQAYLGGRLISSTSLSPSAANF